MLQLLKGKFSRQPNTSLPSARNAKVTASTQWHQGPTPTCLVRIIFFDIHSFQTSSSSLFFPQLSTWTFHYWNSICFVVWNRPIGFILIVVGLIQFILMVGHISSRIRETAVTSIDLKIAASSSARERSWPFISFGMATQSRFLIFYQRPHSSGSNSFVAVATSEIFFTMFLWQLLIVICAQCDHWSCCWSPSNTLPFSPFLASHFFNAPFPFWNTIPFVFHPWMVSSCCRLSP